MEPEVITEEPAATPPARPNTPETRHRALQVGIIARAAGLSPEWVAEQVESDLDLTAIRAAAFDEMQARSVPTIRVQQVGPSNDDPAVILERRAEALACRVMGTAPSEAARPYVSDRLADHAGAILTLRGESVRGMNAEAILTRAAQHTLSDFPNLLTGVGNRILMPAYQAAQSPVKGLRGRRRFRTSVRAASSA